MISERDKVEGKVLISACAVIEGKGHEVLLMYEGDFPYHKQWVLPGGYVRPNETVAHAVAREVEEETGLKIELPVLVGLYEDLLTENDKPVNHIMAAYRTVFAAGRLIFTKEATAYKWLTTKEALGQTEVPDVFKRILNDFQKQHKSGLLRKH